ncbi:MAG: P1 family peptidase [Gammaproteobacteria bacterium]|nr:P1 family peptidase [Gammaproteobacteria bacterium]
MLGAARAEAPAPRARDLGVPFGGTPAAYDAITDVPGVEVGQVTLIRGSGALRIGHGPVRTGVTVVLPRGRGSDAAVHAGFFDLNGNGEMTGRAYLEDYGVAFGPIGLSNTNAIGEVYAGIMQWTSQHFGSAIWPVVAETWDGYLNDIEGFHVHASDAIAAIAAARGGHVDEGDVGGGTGMVCFGFKGGIGTASRRVVVSGAPYVVGVLVQCNTGLREVLRIAGAPVGRELADRWLPCYVPGLASAGREPRCRPDGEGGLHRPDQGSIVIVVGTDAPLSTTQLNRLARRAAMGLARMGSYSGDSSGDLVLSFSTSGTPNAPDGRAPAALSPVENGEIDGLFRATVQATEEAITNALVAARTMTGIDGYTVHALPHADLVRILREYHRLNPRVAARP